MKYLKYILIVIALLAVAALFIKSQYSINPPKAITSTKYTAGLPLDKLQLPDGFQIEVYAEGVTNARSMSLSPSGTLYVGTRSKGNVYALQDTNKDGKIDKQYTLLTKGNMPNGVAFKDGDLYVAEVNRILKFEDIESKLDNPGKPIIVNDSYPNESHHGWKYIAFGPDDKLYVPVGAPCNICDEENEIFNTITRINTDGTGREIVNFPEAYKGQIFVCRHGSWNRKKKIGYDVMMVDVDNNNEPKVFIAGWLDEAADDVWGRPVDIELMSDGSMLISDDFADVIYRVYYEKG